MGLSMAISTLVGQNIGAGNIERAAQIGRLGALLGFASLSFFGVVVFLFAPQLVAFFVPGDPAVIAAGAGFHDLAQGVTHHVTQDLNVIYDHHPNRWILVRHAPPLLLEVHSVTGREMERAKGFEPSTHGLEGRHVTVTPRALECPMRESRLVRLATLWWVVLYRMLYATTPCILQRPLPML